jgi:hypothetical protein
MTDIYFEDVGSRLPNRILKEGAGEPMAFTRGPERVYAEMLAGRLRKT